MRVLFSHGLVALSKPRCGSTSLRRMLDPFVDLIAGDIAVDLGGKTPPFHPHITAPYLKYLLQEQGYNPSTLKFIITVRHPIKMLWSYYKFFKPDYKSRYTFSEEYKADTMMTFEEWIFNGRFASTSKRKHWYDLAPGWISDDDLSSLSLEFRAMNQKGKLEVDKIFQIEEPNILKVWLEDHLGSSIHMRHINKSRSAPPQF